MLPGGQERHQPVLGAPVELGYLEILRSPVLDENLSNLHRTQGAYDAPLL